MQVGEAVYKKKTPEKGQPHPLGPKRLQYAASLLNCVSTIDLQAPEYSSIATPLNDTFKELGLPDLVAQQKVILEHLKTFTTPDLLAPHIKSCTFFKCKKGDKDGKSRFILGIELQSDTIFRYCADVVRVTIEGSGATRADGPPPPGPVVRSLPRV